MRETTEPNRPTRIPQEDWIELKDLSQHASELLGELAQNMEEVGQSLNFDIQHMLNTYNRADKAMSDVKIKCEKQKCSIIQKLNV